MSYADDVDEDMNAAKYGKGQASVPDEIKSLRACIPCMLVKTFTQFVEEGCENCEFLEMRESQSECEKFTTTNFEGLASITDPSSSWVAKWLRVEKLVSGCYAIKVFGQLAPDDEERLVSLNVRNLGRLSLEDD